MGKALESVCHRKCNEGQKCRKADEACQAIKEYALMYERINFKGG